MCHRTKVKHAGLCVSHEVLAIRNKGRKKEVRVRWTDGAVQWETYDLVRRVANEKLKAFRAAERQRQAEEEAS